MYKSIVTIPWITILAFTAIPSAVDGREVEDVAGRVVGEIGDHQIELPLMRADYDVSISGDIATVTLTQEFINPASQPMSAQYLFPLNKSAAVYAMKMHVGDETVEAIIKKKQDAEATFVKAERQGKAAALLTQHRPNMFTHDIANIMPGKPVKVFLSYVQDVPIVDDAHELVLPLIVGPRYQGLDEVASPVAGIQPAADQVAALGMRTAPQPDDVQAEQEQSRRPGQRSDGWTIDPVPAYPPVGGLDLPATIDFDRVSVAVRIEGGGVPVDGMASHTHELDIAVEDQAKRATLAAGRVIDNRDFVLRYELGGETITAGGLAHVDERGGFFSFMIAPPKVPDEMSATPRELVFVLDTSGSMHGAPLDASKAFMDAALAALRPDDSFRIINFSDQAQQFSSVSQRATPQMVRKGRNFVARLAANGGTEIDRAINTAFDAAQPQGTLRIVVFLSDGYIGDEASVLGTIRQRIGKARIYAFGVGTSVNRYLLDGMADEGRGYARYVDPTEDASDVAETFARDLKTPLLTDISIDWGNLDVVDVTPARMSDLFAGGTLRLLGRYQKGGREQVVVKGLVQGRPASLPVQLDLPSAPLASSEQTTAIPLIWARRQIADLERAFAVGDGSPSMLERQITDLGLSFSLQTRYTSFVAVTEQVVNEGQAPLQRSVPLPPVAGVQPSAYGGKQSFAGGSAPEPEGLLGLALTGILASFFLRRRRRQAGG